MIQTFLPDEKRNEKAGYTPAFFLCLFWVGHFARKRRIAARDGRKRSF
jgi:hypothetical protein